MERTYAPPAAHFERTRCAIARLLIPVVWGLALLTLRILPPLHPYRIYATDRMRHTRKLGVRATAIHHGPGRLLPAHLPYLVSAYLVLNALSPRVKGPLDIGRNWWTLDDRVRILHRIAEEGADAAQLVAGLLS